MPHEEGSPLDSPPTDPLVTPPDRADVQGARVSPITAAIVAAVLLAVVAGALGTASRRTAEVTPGPVVAVSGPDTEPYSTPDFPAVTRDASSVTVAISVPPAPAPEPTPAVIVLPRQSVAPPASDEPTQPPSASTPSSPAATPTATTPAPEASATAALAAQREEDLAALALDGRWVAELASREAGTGGAQPGAPEGAEAREPVEILAEHRALRARYGAGVRLLSEADLAHGGAATRWVTVYAPGTFATRGDAAAWCGHQTAAWGEPRCVPRSLPTAS